MYHFNGRDKIILFFFLSSCGKTNGFLINIYSPLILTSACVLFQPAFSNFLVRQIAHTFLLHFYRQAAKFIECIRFRFDFWQTMPFVCVDLSTCRLLFPKQYFHIFPHTRKKKKKWKLLKPQCKVNESYSHSLSPFQWTKNKCLLIENIPFWQIQIHFILFFLSTFRNIFCICYLPVKNISISK